ncbi:MAG: multicopper oxidase domain-containing protein [Okeania sp. SIO3I5]|uniref:multicopper oxidase family protein n=1 Tax=Okeania sp. SIO3I5 TaxID=2607805 RepID=UPI0013B95D4E|nr:multicopper oxidase domain-containing protein [Okeania sp. SIO3I5]NEQ36491.1 multicopper oxidase domain-containing protein [Okeania sp. SIO3I5]
MTEQHIEEKAWENPEPDTPKLGISRRVFLGTGMTAAAAAFILPRQAIAESTCPDVCPYILPTPEPFVSPSFCDPTEVPVGPSQLLLDTCDLTLPDAEGSDYTISVRLYNDLIPGPTFRRDPGEKIEFTLYNELPPNDLPGGQTCSDLQHNNEPGCFNSSNMHFHGLHVSPRTNTSTNISSDDVFVEVSPGEDHQYCVALPEFHAPGTHWYHAHRHGSTAIQAANGMAGAIIIPEPPGERRLGVTNDNDKIWLIQEILDVSDGEAFYTARGNSTIGQFLVNGQYQPTLTIDNPHTLQRWRFINGTGTPRGLMTLKLCKCDDETDTGTDCGTLEDMYLIAVDGISFYGKPPQRVGTDGVGAYQDGWELAPGNRADFLVNLPAGLYKVVKAGYETQNVTPSNNNAQVLAYIQVNEGTDAEGEIPECIEGELPCYLRPVTDQEIDNTMDSGEPGSLGNPQEVSFSTAGAQGAGNYFINGAPYGEGEDFVMNLNTAEQWVLSNTQGSPHPFHIHVNPFQIEGDKIDPSGPDEPSNWRWWDTIAVNRGSSVTIRHRFLDFDGEFVLHCHILIHEDQGMMANVIIDGDGADPCVILPPPNSCPYPAPDSCLESIRPRRKRGNREQGKARKNR